MSVKEQLLNTDHPRSWDMSALSEALQVPAEETHDVAFQAGQRFRIGHDHDPTLEVYPTAGVVRITRTDLRLELFRQAPPHVQAGQLSFEQPGSFVSVSSSGEIVLMAGVEARLQKGQETAGERSAGREIPSGDEMAVLAHPGSTEGHAGDPSPTPTIEAERQRRVQVVGRLGLAPVFRTTHKGKLIAKFPLAVRHADDPDTTWLNILAFDDRAERLKEKQLKKGQAVEVIGYLHERQVRARDGSTKTVQDIYAAAVRDRSGQGQPRAAPKAEAGPPAP